MSNFTEIAGRITDLFEQGVKMVPPRPFSPDNLDGFQNRLNSEFALVKGEHGENIPIDDQLAYAQVSNRIQGYRDAVKAWEIA